MSSIPPFIKDSGSSFNYERQCDKGGSDKSLASCRILRKGLGTSIWFVQFYWPFGDERVTTTRIDLCNAWVTLYNERTRLWSIHEACVEVHQRKFWRKDCTSEQIDELKGMLAVASWLFHELDTFITLLDKFQSQTRIPVFLLPVPPHHSPLELGSSPYRTKPKTLSHELSTLPLLIVYQLDQIQSYTRRMPGWYEGVRKLFPPTWREGVGLPIIETNWSRWVKEQRRIEEESRRQPSSEQKKKSFLGIKFSKGSPSASSSSSSSSMPVQRASSPIGSIMERGKGKPPPYTP
ncbi:hypothetical protein BD324DRAFT_630334 [Kockovaella imperatae]|uniref:Uncharacterized protein n=1 Tax=Kockovaella imperatae TaxID=4999 RepID=A0A1Y1UGE3_9TREE|nr:hypothetical protein BD324DRAFT_630334 [Kockovaella imperatae]ORX36135.1 hypothetical protein BD324DRAFT_630334 [Kockovaella imperatae]